MATITLRLSTKSDKATSNHEILMRFRHGSIDQYSPTNIFIPQEQWDSEKQSIKIPNHRLHTVEQNQLTEELQKSAVKLEEIKSLVRKSFQALDKSVKPEKDWLKNLIHDYNFPPQQEDEASPVLMLDALKEYIDTRSFSISRIRHFKVVWRAGAL